MTKNELRMLMQDKKSIVFLLAGLMKNPQLLVDKEYQLAVDDFPERFHQIVYGAMYNLYTSGAEVLNPIEIDTFLSKYDMQYKVFQDNDGLEVLYKLEELEGVGNLKNMKYHHERVKKFSLLRHYLEQGIDTSDIVDFTTVDTKEAERQNERLDSMTINEIIKEIENRLNEISNRFLTSEGNTGGHMGDNLREILKEKLQSPSYGANFTSKYLTAATRGALPKKVVLVSAPSGVGKSRFSLSNLLTMTIPERWDSKQKKWIKTGATGRGLYVGTELEEDEVKIPALCFIADVDEDKIQNANLTEEEVERLNKAVEILEKTPFWYEELHQFDLDDIEHTILKHVKENDVGFVAYDYIHSSAKLIAYFSRMKAGLQEHQMLLQVSTKLKEIANQYGLFLITSTQLNNNYKDQDNNMDDSSLSGSKAIAQKVDVGGILLPITRSDEQIIESIYTEQRIFGSHPNVSLNLYKNRGNKWKVIRIWMNFNHGTLHCEDLFVTDYKGNIIPNIKPLHVMFDEMEEEDEKNVEFLQEKYDELPEVLEKASGEPQMYDF